MNASEFREASRKVWDGMAAGWDSNREYVWETSRPVGEWLIGKLDPRAGQTVLELAAGMGDTGFIAAQLVGQNGRLISTDFSTAMIDGARRRAAEIGIANAEFRTMDAERMDLDSHSVDGVLCRWGYMLMGNPAAAFAETYRVLKPGGRLCLSVFTTPDKNPWAAMPAKGMIDAGLMDPPQPDAPGIFGLSDRERLLNLLDESGFANPVVEEVPLTWRHENFEDYWRFLNELAGAIATIIASLPSERQAIAREAIAAAIEPYRNGAGFALPGVTLNVSTESRG